MRCWPLSYSGIGEDCETEQQDTEEKENIGRDRPGKMQPLAYDRICPEKYENQEQPETGLVHE
jgi:hypothetical protein